MIKGAFSLFAAAACLALAACNHSNAEPDNGADVAANTAVANTPVVLPPSIKTEATLRCKDNGLVHVTFFTGDTQASVASPPDAAPVMLTAPAAGEPFTADGGWSLKGDAKSVTLAQPGKPEQTCKA